MIESEKLLERKLCNEVKKLGGMCIKWLPFLIAGLPDRICLLPGAVIIFVEVKTTNQKVKPVQLVMHKRIRRLGFRVEVLDKAEQIKDILC